MRFKKGLKYKLSQQTINQRHILKRYTLDIETFDYINTNLKMSFGGKTILIGLYDGKEYKEFNKFKDCIEYIFSRSERSIIYTHNAGKFDYLYYLNECINDFALEKMLVINGGIIFSVCKGKQKILLRDSYRILPASLKSLCKSFAPQYSKIEMDYDKEYQLSEIQEYLKYDCISLFEIINIFESEIRAILKDNEFTIDKYYTIASMAFRILISKYLNGVTHNFMSKDTEDFVRESYYGGRVEIYKHYGTDLNYYDINSLYPFAMHNNFYPIGKMFKVSQFERIKDCINSGYLGFVKCKIIYPNNYYCLLPVRINNKELIFPYGTFEGIYTTPELQYALKEGAYIEYHKGLFWTEKKKIFTDFVNDFYKIKMESKGAKKIISKLLLNSSYGKFGMKRKRSIIITEKEALKKLDHLVNYKCLAGGKFFTTTIDNYKNRNINPVYASFITAYARIELFNHLKLNDVLYCDTDSIICSNKMDSQFIDSKKLGLFKQEVEQVKEAYFISPKLYGLKIKDKISKYSDEEIELLKKNHKGIIDNEFIHFESVKAKGVDGEIINGMDFNKIKEMSITKNFTYDKKRIVGFMQKFSRIDYKDNLDFVNFENQLKKLNCEYDKRKRIGNITYPIDIKEVII